MVRYRKQLIADARAAYDAAGPAQKMRIATFFLRVGGTARRPNGTWVIGNAEVFQYMQALANDASARWSLVLNVARHRVAVPGGLSRAAVDTLLAHLLAVEAEINALGAPTIGQLMVLRDIRHFRRHVLGVPDDADPAQQTVAGLDFATATEADLDRAADVWGQLPEDGDPIKTSDDLPPTDSV